MRAFACVVTMLLTVLLIAACLFVAGSARPSDTPPPEAARQIMERIKQGYNTQDVDLLCGEFAEIMFTNGFTKEKFLEVNQSLLQKLGAWDFEVYTGEDNGVYTWEGTFSQGSAKIVIVIDAQNKVTGLWFR